MLGAWKDGEQQRYRYKQLQSHHYPPGYISKEKYDFDLPCRVEQFVLTDTGDNAVDISVRSRDDKKKPTCSYEGTAKKIATDVYESIYNDKTILFTFTDSTVVISAKNKEDENILYFFCSGGASLKCTYFKLTDSDITDKNE